MNYQAPPQRILRPEGLPPTTQAAEGMERRRFTVAEIEAAVEAGIIDGAERFEMIDGEIVPMSPKGIRHEVIKGALNEFWIKRKPANIRMIPETTFRLNEVSFLEPDFVFFESATQLKDLNPSNALLCVEVSELHIALRHWPQSQTLCQPRCERTLGHRRGNPANPHLHQAHGRGLYGAETGGGRRGASPKFRTGDSGENE